MNATHSTHSTHGTDGADGDKTRARLLALAMHAVFILLIVFGVSWQKKPQPPVEAELWSNLPPLPQPRAEVTPTAEPAREPPPPAPKMVQVPLKPDIAIKRAEKEKPLPPKPVPRPDDTARLDRERQQREAKDTEAKAARERDAQREAAEREAKAVADKIAAEKAAAERAARAAAARDNQKYFGGIQAKVWARVALPADLQGNPEAEFLVSLLPGGELESVTMRKSSGNAAYDASIERAIRQAQPFVVPGGDEFQRSFRRIPMTFRPQR